MKISSPSSLSTEKSRSSFEMIKNGDDIDVSFSPDSAHGANNNTNDSGIITSPPLGSVNCATASAIKLAGVVGVPAASSINGDIDQAALLSVTLDDEEKQNEGDVGISCEIITASSSPCCQFCCASLAFEPYPRIGNYCCTLTIEPCPRIGNCVVLFPRLYEKTGFGIVGPHWWGLTCTFALLLGAGLLVTNMAVHLTTTNSLLSAKPMVCIFFTVLASILLLFTGLTNPGIVTDANSGYTGVSSGREWRWCQVCRVHQPPKAVHCPDCNVCIAEYDHHCPWMGTCIGKKNYRAFVQFNLSWFLFLMFVIGFVAFENKHE